MDRRVGVQKTDDDQAEAEADLLARHPEDVLADVLRLLAPRDVAASRCVCKAWRTVVDARRLLRTELLPLWVGGIFINFHNYSISELFSRPSASRPSISGRHDYLPHAGSKSWSKVRDHCNGLLLVKGYSYVLHRTLEYVLNPATRWCAPLPPLSTQDPEREFADPYRDIHDKYLVYDPTVSMKYKVFLIPRFRTQLDPTTSRLDYATSYMNKLDPVIEQSEWPPSPCIMQVFSSRTGQWGNRSFLREGQPAGTVADIRQSYPYDQRNAVYWRGALYVHCQTDFLMRISVSKRTYKVIKPPTDNNETYYPQFYLGKSKDGVYCAEVSSWFCLRVWILDESGNHIEWVLKHDVDLAERLSKHIIVSRHDYQQQVRGPWTLQNINNWHYKERNKNGIMEEPVEDNFEWSSEVSSDENSRLDNDSDDSQTGGHYSGYLDILGFHPFKEIIFLSESITTGLAYDFNSSTVQVLGNLYPAGYEDELPNEQLITSSFPYTPCWLGHKVDENNLEGHLDS